MLRMQLQPSLSNSAMALFVMLLHIFIQNLYYPVGKSFTHCNRGHLTNISDLSLPEYL